MNKKPMEFGKSGTDQICEHPLKVNGLIKEMRKKNNLHFSRIN